MFRRGRRQGRGSRGKTRRAFLLLQLAPAVASDARWSGRSLGKWEGGREVVGLKGGGGKQEEEKEGPFAFPLPSPRRGPLGRGEHPLFPAGRRDFGGPQGNLGQRRGGRQGANSYVCVVGEEGYLSAALGPAVAREWAWPGRPMRTSENRPLLGGLCGEERARRSGFMLVLWKVGGETRVFGQGWRVAQPLGKPLAGKAGCFIFGG